MTAHGAWRQGMAVAAVALALLSAPRQAMHATPSPASGWLVRGDVAVARAAAGDAWTIGASGAPLALGFARDGALVIRGLGADGAGSALALDVADAPIVIDGREVVLGDRPDEGVHFAGDRLEDYRGGVRLSLYFNVPEAPARVLRHFAVYPGSPVIETWFEVERLDGEVPVSASSIAAWRVGALGRDVRWRRGLLMNDDPDLSFSEQVRTLGEGEALVIGSAGRATEQVLPWVSVQTPAGTFFGGLLWSGGWRIEAQGDAAGTRLTARLDDVVTEVPAGHHLEGVRGFFGVVPGGEAEIAEAMRGFLVDGLRRGRGFPALVSYNTWFVHGVNIDDELVAREVHEAAKIGAELFQLDAGWYTNTGREGRYDYTAGLGTWEVDRERFREGLRGAGAVIKAAGLRFGLWVEPERADLATVGTPTGPREAWLATTGGVYRPGHDNADAGYAQICLAHPDAWQWAYHHLARLVAEEGVEYFVFDNNDWIDCTREGHGHGPRDGHFAHVQALYRLLEALRERFPALLIENCAGGGNRIDFGLARYTDSGWMDDRTNPAAHVRQNHQALSHVLPPHYLLSYVMPSPEEPMEDEHDLRLLTRSRMGGILGLSYRADELDEGDYAVLAREVEVYKRVRALVANGSAVVLSPSMTGTHRPAWELVQHTAPSRQAAIVLAFQNDGAVEAVRVVPQRLDPGRTYAVSTMDLGPIGTFPGTVLERDGVELRGSPNSAARILLIEPVAASTSGPARTKRP